jgi:hypothetical protein
MNCSTQRDGKSMRAFCATSFGCIGPTRELDHLPTMMMVRILWSRPILFPSPFSPFITTTSTCTDLAHRIWGRVFQMADSQSLVTKALQHDEKRAIQMEAGEASGGRRVSCGCMLQVRGLVWAQKPEHFLPLVHGLVDFREV